MAKKKNYEKLEALTPQQRAEVYKVAAKLRKAALAKKKKSRNASRRDYKSSLEKHTGKESRDLDDWALKVLSKAGEFGILDKISGEQELRDDLKEGVVVQISKKEGELYYDGEIVPFRLPTEMLMLQKTLLAVGERVLFYEEEGKEVRVVHQTLAREQILSRPDPTRPEIERVIAVNVDHIIIVTTIDNPRLNTNLIDRFLIAIGQTTAKPVICVNKMDLLSEDTEEDLEKLKAYEDLGIPIIRCSAHRSDGLDDLIDLISNKTCVFLGTSGVGKSSLLNALDPDLDLDTQENRKSAGRGRHTTVLARMYFLQHGIRLIDTPGVREFNFLDVTVEEIQFYFSEFTEYHDCKFSDCLHTHEKGCGIKAAVERGDIAEARYQSYLKIMESLNVKRVKKQPRDPLF